ncbi:hypothetical protein GCM10011348_11320 [Marinobacterium nitratireducens]|uniref:DUF1820 domain-containing protein n=1 Tax=Marinobacterium nitratireducens TaxID=518897 RepID=A0A918DQX6_9GAMM|nr:DUF1820 family protein [Marinobacterium nitratireducens]GGO78716.1 hypothetical protein GCM10011348_11320 [Marinobacterium nitratireducens]
MASDDRMYRVQFVNQDQVYELYARHVYQSEMWGFIEVEAFVFGNRSEVLVDPGEEKLKKQFGDVKRSFIPMQAIIRIDEVQHEGVPRISEAKGTVTAFPVAVPPRGSK